MKCEVEFMPVGEGTRAGDAIVIRYGEEDNFDLMVVDGGTLDAGEAMIAHIQKHFGAGAVIEHMVLTHGDADHASGLREVLKVIPVRNLWLHVPWVHAQETIHLFLDKNMSVNQLREKLVESCDIVVELVNLAQEKGTNIHFPFQGEKIGPFTVMSPSRYAYNHLLPQFPKTPEPDKDALTGLNMWLGKGQPPSLFAKLMEKAQSWVTETWGGERLKDGGQTSAKNESSVVLYADLDSRKYLLTGDAGVNALSWAANHAIENGLPLKQFSFVQIPHHGSRRNVGPTILNRLIGEPIPEGADTTFSAFVSCPTKDDTHPRKIVKNAFIRRGGRVLATEGTGKCYPGGFANKTGYSAATPEPFSTQVEEYT